MQKVKTLKELKSIVKKEQSKGKKVGLITGCFDILHTGHVDLFEFAKKNVDVLIVGVANDKSITLSKGLDRPVFSVKQRLHVLSNIKPIDFLFVNRNIYNFGSSKAPHIQSIILKMLNPNILITNSNADEHWRMKKKLIKPLGIKFLIDRRKKVSSSSKIAQKIQELL